MEMSTYDLPEESALIIKTRKAAYCAHRGRDAASTESI